MRRRAATTGLLVVLAGYAIVYWASLHLSWHTRGLWFVLFGSMAWGLALLLLARGGFGPRQTLAVVFAVGALLQVLGWTSRPTTSDDVYRYVWDGTVQLHGVDPYRYPPQAPELSELRTPLLFGPSDICRHKIPDGCTAINRPSVRTVYPPVAQLAFDAVRIVSFGGHGGPLPFQIAASLGVLAVGVVLALARRRNTASVWPLAIWLWCPLVVTEFGNNAHLDWLAVLLAVLAFRAATAGRTAAAGGLLGAAIATKLYPVVLLPVLAARRTGRFVLAALAVVVIGYVPHVLAVGAKVIGYLPGYLDEEGYQSGTRLLLLGHVLPHPLDTVVGAALLLAAAVAVFVRQRRHPGDPAVPATLLTGLTFLVTTPGYGWYAALLVALVVWSERWEWLAVALAPMVTYLTYQEVSYVPWHGPVIYLTAGVIAAAGTLVRRRAALTEVSTARETKRSATSVPGRPADRGRSSDR